MAYPAYRLYQWVWTGLDWIFPPACGGCKARGLRWCDECMQNTRLVTEPFCPRCGQSQVDDALCKSCRNPQPFQAIRSWAFFDGPVRSAIHQLKYHRDIGLGEFFGGILLQLLNRYNWPVEMIVPMPLSARRLSERGYNQSSLLALPVALGAKLPYSSGAVWRVRETRSQVDLSFEERQNNVAGAFAAKDRLVREKTVLLVDDVITSGATINACCRALIDAGAKAVYGLTLARTEHLRSKEMHKQ